MSLASAIEVAAPHLIGPYAVERELGRGGMGAVYLARHVDGGPNVALKLALPGMARYLGYMRREIHALSRLRHPGVVRILDSGAEHGAPWYAMELLDGATLEEFFRGSNDASSLVDPDAATGEATAVVPVVLSGVTGGQRMRRKSTVRGDLNRGLTLMYRLARILAYVHGRGMVHRDLKPANVLVQEGDRPVLVDFGVMSHFRAQGGREVIEVSGTMVGTVNYASPEQARGELVDARSDLYTFGVMLYELLTGAPPFGGRTAGEVLEKHSHETPVPPSEFVTGVPPLVEELTLNLLRKRPADRLGYAEDVAARLVAAGANPDPDLGAGETAAYLYRPEIVGRASTIESLAPLIPKAWAKSGSFVVLGGESGIGKTSVAAAFAREATICGISVVTGESEPVGGGFLHPLRPLLRDVADVCRADRAAFDEVLGARLSVLREYEPSLAALAGDDTPRIPQEIAARRLNADLAETLAALARAKPLMLIIEDLQWADEGTLRFLSSLDAEFFDGVPLLIVGTYRADEVGPDLRQLLAKQHVKKVLLGRLDESSVADIVRSMLAAPNAPAAFLEYLAAQSEGNPFFVAEYLRAAVDARLLLRREGRWSLETNEAAYASLGLPDTLRDLIGGRLDRLTVLARRVAEAAAVVGRDADESLLIAVSGLTEGDVADALSELIEHQMFDAGGEHLRFSHDKLREGAYARIETESRARMHARAADALEASFADESSLETHAAEIARHYDVAGVHTRATLYYAQAAEVAVRTGACREGVELMNRALAIDAGHPVEEPARKRPLRRARWHRILGQAHFGLGDLVASADHARTSLAAIGLSLPDDPAGWKRRLGFEALRQMFHLALPRRLLRARRSEHESLLEIALSAQTYSEGSYFCADGSIMVATALLAANSAERIGGAVGRMYASLGATASGMGLHRLARHYIREGRRLATATLDLDGLARLGYSSLAEYVATCDWTSCERWAGDAVAVARETGDDQVLEVCETGRGFYEFYTGQLAATIATYTTIRDRARKRSNHQHEAWGHSGLARTFILTDRLEEALVCVQEGRTLLEGQDDYMTELILNAHEPLALLHLGRLDEAVAAADATRALMMKSKYSMWEMFRGYAAPIEVYLEACTRVEWAGRAEEMRAAIRTLLVGLRELSRRAPFAIPISLRLRGRFELLTGNHHRGEKLLRQSVAAAARLALPIDEAMGAFDLAGTPGIDPRERGILLDRVRRISRDIGCALYLRKCKGAS
jgi:serine/threonine protein kinase